MTAKRPALVALGLLATLGFASLSVWQVERRAWKLDLIARVEARVHAPAEPLPGPERWPAVDERTDGHRHVALQGTFAHECETPVQAMTERGAGFWIVTPLRMKDGVTVLVNRGFVPPERRDRATRRQAEAEGPVAVGGLLRISEPRGGFLRANDPAAGRWYSRDVEAIARKCGLENAAPFFVDADAASNPGGYPIGGLTVVAFRNSHLVYALTWFALALMSVFGTAMFLRPASDT